MASLYHNGSFSRVKPSADSGILGLATSRNQSSSGGPLPSSQRRGGCATKKMSRSLRSGADGVVGHTEMFRKCVAERWRVNHHPVRSYKEASRYLLDVASTPAVRRGVSCPKNFVKKQDGIALLPRRRSSWKLPFVPFVF